MKRAHAFMLALPIPVFALLAAGPAPPADPSPSAISADSTAAVLDALRREVQRPALDEDPFEEGRKPDLVVLSSTDVRGETGPCG